MGTRRALPRTSCPSVAGNRGHLLARTSSFAAAPSSSGGFASSAPATSSPPCPPTTAAVAASNVRSRTARRSSSLWLAISCMEGQSLLYLSEKLHLSESSMQSSSISLSIRTEVLLPVYYWLLIREQQQRESFITGMFKLNNLAKWCSHWHIED